MRWARRISIFFRASSRRNSSTTNRHCIKSGTAILELEEPGLDKVTGEERIVVTSKVPLRDENGMVIGIIGLGFDITERKRAEQRLAAGERLESIGRLAAGVAHEINTPIQYLNDSVYLHPRGDAGPDGPQPEAAGRIAGAARAR